MNQKTTEIIEAVDAYIKAHPAVSGKRITEHFNLTEKQWWKVTPHLKASHGNYGYRTMYWHGERPEKPFIFPEEMTRSQKVQEFLKTMPILTVWVGGNPFAGARV